MARVDERVEPLLEPARDDHRVAAIERGDEEVVDAGQAIDVVLVGASHREPRRVFEKENARLEDVVDDVGHFARVGARLQKWREQIERARFAKIGDRDALAVSHGDEPRLLELPDRFAQGVPVRPVFRRELALAGESLARLELAAEDLPAQLGEDSVGDVRVTNLVMHGLAPEFVRDLSKPLV